MYHRSDHDNDKYRSSGPGSSYFSGHGSSSSSPLANYAGIEGQKKEEEKKKEEWKEEDIKKYRSKDDKETEGKKKGGDADESRKQDALKSWSKKGIATLDEAVDAAAKSIDEAIEGEKKAIKVR